MYEVESNVALQSEPTTIGRADEIESRLADCPSGSRVSLLVFSGEYDKLLAAFVIATGAAASDMQVDMFFTFWGAAALKKRGPQRGRKSLVELHPHLRTGDLVLADRDLFPKI